MTQGYFIEDKEETEEENFYVTKQEYLNQRFIATMKFNPKPRFGADVKYHYEDFDFRKENIRDSKGNQILFDIYYILSDRLRAIGGYQYRERDFKNYPTVRLKLLGLGIQYELAPRINSKLILEYEDIARRGREYDASAFLLDISGQLNERTTSYFTFEQATKYTRALINPVKLKIAKVNILRALNEQTNLNLAISSLHGKLQDSNRKDKLQTITLTLSHQISKDISFNVDYNHLNRKSNIFDECIRNNIYSFNIQIH